jgi:predicted DNA binding CopG/RHH family protein
MKKKITYTDEPKDVDLDNARIMEDFLPSPEELVLKKDRIVTLRLDASTISDLKKIAAQKGLGVSSLVRMWVRERLNN